MRHTRNIKRLGLPTKVKKRQKKSIPWRDVFKKDIAKYSEPGIMLRGSRIKEEITQKELANAIGVSQHHISEMENGKRPIGKAMAKRFADFFKTNYRIFL
jgi:DNA-binding XRE family transcriptional regulator